MAKKTGRSSHLPELVLNSTSQTTGPPQRSSPVTCQCSSQLHTFITLTTSRKFSQTSIDVLQAALDGHKSRSQARISSLEVQLQATQKALADSQQQVTRLRDALDELTEDISRETFGRRREIALRLKFVNREEQIVEALRGLSRRIDEGQRRLSTLEAVSEGNHLSDAAREFLCTLLDEAAGLLASVEHCDPKALLAIAPDNSNGRASSSLARVIASEETVTALVEELERETERRLDLERRLGDGISLGSSEASEATGDGNIASSDLGIGWSKETLVAQQLTVHAISPYNRLTFSRGSTSPLDSAKPSELGSVARHEGVDEDSRTADEASKVSKLEPSVIVEVVAAEIEAPPLDLHAAATKCTLPSDVPRSNSPTSDVEPSLETEDSLLPLAATPPSPKDVSPTPNVRALSILPSASESVTTVADRTADDNEAFLLSHLPDARDRYQGIVASLKNCVTALLRVKALLPSTPIRTTATTGSDTSLAEAYLARLNDVLEDCQVEVEIQIADETRLVQGFSTVLAIPTALSTLHERHGALQEARRFIQRSDSDTSPHAAFKRKVDDIEHDVALLKRFLHDGQIADDAPSPALEDNLMSPSSWARPGNLLQSPASRSRPQSPIPTIGAVVTQPKSLAHELLPDTASPVKLLVGCASSLTELPFRITMPKPTKSITSPPINPGIHLPGHMNPYFMRSRTVSSSGLGTPRGGRPTPNPTRYASATYSAQTLSESTRTTNGLPDRALSSSDCDEPKPLHGRDGLVQVENPLNDIE